MKCSGKHDTKWNIPRISRYPRHISCYIVENRFPFWQCTVPKIVLNLKIENIRCNGTCLLSVPYIHGIFIRTKTAIPWNIYLSLVLTLITPAVVPKWCTLFEIIFWNNFAGLNMCCAPLNAAHFEGRWVWLSFNINFYKDGTPPAPPSVHHCVHHIWCNTGALVTRVNRFVMSFHVQRIF